MATAILPVAPPDIAREVIDPKAYAEWDGLLDTFDWLREHMPVARIEPPEPGLFPPFWLVTRYDDVMRISKDNATFLNNPRSVVFEHYRRDRVRQAVLRRQRTYGSEPRHFRCADPHEVPQADARLVHAQEAARYRRRGAGDREGRGRSAVERRIGGRFSSRRSPRPIRCTSSCKFSACPRRTSSVCSRSPSRCLAGRMRT